MFKRFKRIDKRIRFQNRLQLPRWTLWFFVILDDEFDYFKKKKFKKTAT